MRAWDFSIPLDPHTGVPIFAQIARAIAGDVRRGRLRPGSVLPGTRALAQTLGVHRNTVIAAYGELAAEGWITSERGRGTFISTTLPDPQPRRFASAPHITVDPVSPFDLGPSVTVPQCPSGHPATYNLAGWPDLRLLPTGSLARAWRRSVERHGRQTLSYVGAQGHPQFRAALASMLSATRGVAVDASGVLVTRGSQGALTVVAHGLLRPGDVVAVENPGYRRAWQVLSMTGARVVPIPVDAHGLSIDRLAAAAEREGIRAVFVTPHHQFPTTVTLSPARRRELLELARRYRFAIIEDDYDHEFHFDGRPILPLASADTCGSVIYIGTLSKTLAPGLRLGYIAASRPVIAHLTQFRALLDTQGDSALELAVAELIEDGEVQRHVRKSRRIYRARRDAMLGLLARELGDALTVGVPVGGTALWVRVAADIDAERWCQSAAARGVLFETGDRFSFDNEQLPYLRLGYAGYREAELADAVRLLAEALNEARGASRLIAVS
ncbi:MAG TPA: PLP-dependent aminotransferase family protein [Vicinamibacterales bacterium]|nr:PLP-dependent aminotransferase family protein [Vicinamibacterales bacterium]